MNKEFGQQIDVKQALDLARDFTSKSHKRKRIHQNSQQLNANNIRALKGLCGNCTNLIALSILHNEKKMLRLRCKAGHWPDDLYDATPFGEDIDCSDFVSSTDQD